MRRAKPCSKALNLAPAPSSVLAARAGLTRLERGLWALCASRARFGPNHWALLQTAIQQIKNTSVGRALSLSHPEYLKHQHRAQTQHRYRLSLLCKNTALTASKTQPVVRRLYSRATRIPVRTHSPSSLRTDTPPDRNTAQTRKPTLKNVPCPPTTNPTHPQEPHTHIHTQLLSDQCTPNEAMLCCGYAAALS